MIIIEPINGFSFNEASIGLNHSLQTRSESFTSFYYIFLDILFQAFLIPDSETASFSARHCTHRVQGRSRRHPGHPWIFEFGRNSHFQDTLKSMHCRYLHLQYISTTTLEMYASSDSGVWLQDVVHYISSTSISRSADVYDSSTSDQLCCTLWKIFYHLEKACLHR